MVNFESNENSKTLLVYNRDFHKQSMIAFKDCLNLCPGDLYKIFYSYRYRSNTGTYLMTDTLVKLLDAKWIYPNDFESIESGKADTLVTNAFHCISPRFYFDKTYWQRILDSGIRVVPMTCGFRYHEDGKMYLTKDIVYILKQISERNEIGVRGEKAADILEKNGIKNVRIIGCHSLFYWNNRKYEIKKEKRSIHSLNFNFNQCYSDYFESHVEFCERSLPFFNYIYNLFLQNNIDIKYTMQTAFFKEWTGFNNFSNYEILKRFPEECGRYYFSVDDWVNGISDVDFSIGTQFHGSVAAILAGIPTLMITIDDRMRELCKVHSIPNIDISEFRQDKPIEYYYDLIDYSDFNRNYSANYDNFFDYCTKNGVILRNE